MNFYSCNAGLLDAINIHEIRECNTGDREGDSFVIEGNVAQAFDKLGGIDTITAYDGSVAFWPIPYNRLPRISRKQNSFFDYLERLKTYKVVDVKRVNYSVADDIYYASDKDNQPYLNDYGVLPNGEVLYDCVKNTATYTYYQTLPIQVPVVVGGNIYTKVVNMKILLRDVINY